MSGEKLIFADDTIMPVVLKKLLTAGICSRNRIFAKKIGKAVRPDGFAEIEALHFVADLIFKKVRLFPGFHAFGDNFQHFSDLPIKITASVMALLSVS